MKNQKTFKIGDRVKYRVEFLRSIGAYYGAIPFERGTVVSIKERNGWTLIEVDFGREPFAPMHINAANLTLASDPENGAY